MYYKIASPMLSIIPLQNKHLHLILNGLKLKIYRVTDEIIEFEEFKDKWNQTKWIMVRDTFDIVYTESKNRHKLFFYGKDFTVEKY